MGENGQVCREGWQWWRSQLDRPDRACWQPSATPISEAAVTLTVKASVGDEDQYQARHARPHWPGGEAGITVGIGYDVGYTTSALLTSDWRSRIDEMLIHRLEGKIGVTGERSKGALADLFKRIEMRIEWEDALWVHRYRLLPRITGMVERSFGNSWRLGPNGLGALVSLAWNRGVRFGDQGESVAAMRQIAHEMNSGNFAVIPQLIASMKDLWPANDRQAQTRQAEAALFEEGLSEILH